MIRRFVNVVWLKVFVLSIFLFLFLFVICFSFVRISGEYENGNESFEISKSIFNSRFGSVEYNCDGFCFCEKQNMQKSGISSLRITVVYFLSAATSVIAVKQATEYFTDKCSNSIIDSEECEPSMVRAEVTECKKVSPKIDTVVRKENVKKEGEKIWKYFCNGNCIPKNPTFKKRCENLKTNGIIKIDLTGNEHNFPNSRTRNNKARKDFIKKHLAPLCKTGGKKVAEVYDLTINKESKRKKWRSVCVGQRGRQNHSVKCRQVYPKPNYSEKKK